MNERIKELAEQVGLLTLWVCVNEPTGSQMIKRIDQEIIERFAELVRQDEREACAKLCDDIADRIMGDNVTGSDGAGYCVKEIRAISNNRTKTSKDICGND
jgi:hypothetical protein